MDLVGLEFKKILKTVGLTGLEGLLNLLPLPAEGFAMVFAFSDKKKTELKPLVKVVKETPLSVPKLCNFRNLYLFEISRFRMDQSNTP